MNTEIRVASVAPALRALLDAFLDYAGIFPPAKVALQSAVSNYCRYRDGGYSWMLHWFVIGASEVEQVPHSLDGSLSVLSANEDEQRAAAIETTAVVTKAKFPVYCEVPIGQLSLLDRIKEAGCYAKIRTGGVKPEAIPSTSDVADFILSCAERRLPFKATAGLHHAIRAVHPLTYEADAPRATMHGFLNVLLAAAFAWQGEADIEPIISETDAHAFAFDESARWRDLSLSVDQIRSARKDFIHCVGSCSFEEPIEDLQNLGLLRVR